MPNGAFCLGSATTAKTRSACVIARPGLPTNAKTEPSSSTTSDVSCWRANRFRAVTSLRPGTAVLGARLGGTLVVGLSGNPVAAMTSFEILGRPVLAAMLGRPFRRDLISAVLEQEVQGSSVHRYMRARLGHRNGRWRADVAMSQKSGVLSSLTSANGYVIIPELSGRVPQGSDVQSFTL